MLPLVAWEPTANNNGNVLNDTLDFYRYFDAAAHAEFLFECVARTIDENLPREADFLRRHDLFRAEATATVDMPDRLLAFCSFPATEWRLAVEAGKGERVRRPCGRRKCLRWKPATAVIFTTRRSP